MNYNKIILGGNLTRDPELRHTQGGTAIAKFGMAINRKWSQNGESKETVCFVDCTAFGKTAEVLAEHVKKGSKLLVEGRLELQQWEDKETGAKRSKHEVAVESFQFVGDRKEAASEEPAPRRKRAEKPASDTDYGEIPF